MYVCMYVFMYVCMYVCMYVFMYLCMYVGVGIWPLRDPNKASATNCAQHHECKKTVSNIVNLRDKQQNTDEAKYD